MKNYRTMKRFITTVTCFLALFAFSPIFAATFTVTTTSNDGPGSLRQAIEDANDSAGVDIIEFNIGGVAPHTIALTSQLPNIKEGVTMDGGGQISISDVGYSVLYLFNAHGSTIKGLNFFKGSPSSDRNYGVRILASNNVTLDGIDVSGRGQGIGIFSSEEVTVKNCNFTGSGWADYSSSLEVYNVSKFKGFGNNWSDHDDIKLRYLSDFLVTDAIPTTGDHYLVLEPTSGVRESPNATMYIEYVNNSTFENFDYSSESILSSYQWGMKFEDCKNILVDDVRIYNKSGVYFASCDEIDLINSDLTQSEGTGTALQVSFTTNFRGSNNKYSSAQIALQYLTDFLVTDALPSTGSHYLVVEPTSGGVARLEASDVDNSTFENIDLSKESPCVYSPKTRMSCYSCDNIVVDNINVANAWTGMSFSSGDNIELKNSDFSGSCGSYPLAVRKVSNFKGYENKFTNSARGIILDSTPDMLVTNTMPAAGSFLVLKDTDGIKEMKLGVLELFDCPNMIVDGVDFTKEGTKRYAGIRISDRAENNSYIFRNLIFENNSIGIYSYNRFATSTISVTCSSFKACDAGIRVTGTSSPHTIKDNHFSCTRAGGISSDVALIAEGNYWGDSSGPLNDGGTGERYYGSVDALPFLTSSPTCAPSVSEIDVNITASDTSICPGEEVVLNAGVQDSYLWSNSAVTQTTAVTPTTNTTYGIQVTDAKGCKANAAVTVSVTPFLTFDTDNATQSTTPTGMQVYSVDVCGDLTGFTSNMTSSGGISFIQFLPSATVNCQTAQVTYTNGVDWTLEVETASGCRSYISSEDVVSVGGVPLLVIDAVNVIKDETCIGDKDGELSVQVSGGDLSCGNYTFNWAGSSGITGTTQTLTGLGKGSYQVTVTDCVGTSVAAAQLVRVVNGGGRGGRGRGGCKTAVETLLSDFRLQPNPAHDYVQVYFEAATESNQVFQVSLLDLAGRVLQQVETDADGMMNLDLNSVIDGLYIVQIQSNGQILEKAKLVVVK